MSIERETFSNYLIQKDGLLYYGFQPNGDNLIYVKKLPEDHLEIILTYDGAFRGKIMDLISGEEYTNFRNEKTTGYSAGIRQQFIDLLMDIREMCCRNLYFKSQQAQRINAYICETYGGKPEFLWPSIPSYAAFRLEGSKKWYAIMGSVPLYKLDAASDSHKEVEVINVKVDSTKIKDILSRKGFYPAFHMNKKCWVSIILDDTLVDAEIEAMIQASYRSV